MKATKKIMVVIRQNGKYHRCSLKTAIQRLTIQYLDSRVVKIFSGNSLSRIIRHRIWSAVSRKRKVSRSQVV